MIINRSTYLTRGFLQITLVYGIWQKQYYQKYGPIH